MFLHCWKCLFCSYIISNRMLQHSNTATVILFSRDHNKQFKYKFLMTRRTQKQIPCIRLSCVISHELCLALCWVCLWKSNFAYWYRKFAIFQRKYSRQLYDQRTFLKVRHKDDMLDLFRIRVNIIYSNYLFFFANNRLI